MMTQKILSEWTAAETDICFSAIVTEIQKNKKKTYERECFFTCAFFVGVGLGSVFLIFDLENNA